MKKPQSGRQKSKEASLINNKSHRFKKQVDLILQLYYNALQQILTCQTMISVVQVDKLIWEVWNIQHIAKHGVSTEEVEKVCHSTFVVRESYKGRLLIIGKCEERRYLTIILSPQEKKGVYYPVTARVAARKEREYFKQTV